MTEDELKAHGLHECPDCHSTYPSQWAAEACCSPDYDLPRFARQYELGNN